MEPNANTSKDFELVFTIFGYLLSIMFETLVTVFILFVIIVRKRKIFI